MSDKPIWAAIRRAARDLGLSAAEVKDLFRATRADAAGPPTLGCRGARLLEELREQAVARRTACFRHRGPLTTQPAKSRPSRLRKARQLPNPTHRALVALVNQKERDWGWLRAWADKHAPDYVKEAIRRGDPRAMTLARRAYFRAKAQTQQTA